MKLLQELVNQADLSRSDGSDAGSTDIRGKGAEVKFDLMRNTINSDGKVSGSGVADYLERAHELNDEVETVLYGLETSDGEVVKVYVNATQADAFEAEMKKMLGMEDDIEEAINALAGKFDIVDVIWPQGSQVDGETPPEDEVNLDATADIGNPDDAEEDDDMETIASIDDEERADASPPTDDEAPADDTSPPKDKADKPKKPAADEPPADEEPAPEEGSEEEAASDAPAKDKKDDKPKKKGEKHSLLKSIGGGLAGKSKVTEGEVIKADFSKGKGVDNKGIDIPKGYDRFEVDGNKIIGIKGDKKSTVSTTTDPKLTAALVQIYNGGKANVSVKPLSMLQAFGSRELAAAADVGIKLTEKPSYWEDFEEGGFAVGKNVDEVKLKKLEKTVGKLKTYSGKDIYGSDAKPRGPLIGVKTMPKEDMFIVKFDDGSRYVADQTGARTYIRMWQKIN